MNRRNYARELSRLIEKTELLPSPYRTGRPTLLLHACCGPCSSSVLEQLVPHFEVTVFWYNPNLYPEPEFEKRLAAQKELLKKAGLEDRVKLLETNWRGEEYRVAVRGRENAPEGGARCEACFRLRLTECAGMAKEAGYDFFGTTLTVSRHKNTQLINRIGEEIAAETGTVWLPADFKKNNGENRSVELSEQYGLYRQDYCGCEFSLRSRNSAGNKENDGKAGIREDGREEPCNCMQDNGN